MKNEIFIKNLPSYLVYYKDGIIKDFSKITEFILSSAEECLKLNPNLKCIKPDYCFVSYLSNEYKENDISIRYAQAVENIGKENENIKFMELKPIKALCIYHKGPFQEMKKSYDKILNYVKENNYEIIDFIRECYVDGPWNKDNESEYLSLIQIPIK